MSTSKVLLGVAFGMVTGALAGILTAPDSGRNTRNKISRKSQGFVDDMKNKANSFKDGFKYRLETAMEDGHHLLDQPKSKIENAPKKSGNYSS